MLVRRSGQLTLSDLGGIMKVPEVPPRVVEVAADRRGRTKSRAGVR